MTWDMAETLIRTVGEGIVIPLILAWVGMRIRNQDMRDAIDKAAQRAGGIAADYFHNRATGMSDAEARSIAIAAAVDYMMKTVPDALKHFGKDSDDVHEMAKAEAAKQLPPPPVVQVAVVPPTPPSPPPVS